MRHSLSIMQSVCKYYAIIATMQCTKNYFLELLRSYPLNLLLAMRNASCENFIKIVQLWNPGFEPRSLSFLNAPALKSPNIKAIAK